MTRASGPGPGTSGGELEPRSAEAVPVEPSRVAGGAPDDEAARLRRRLRWLLGFGVALALALASFATVLRGGVYEARASVLIRAPDVERGAPRATGSALQSEAEILQSFEVLRQTLERIGAGVLYPGLEGESIGAVRAAAVTRMREALAVRTSPGSDVMEVSFRHADPELAAEAVNRLVERFRRSRREVLAPAASQRFLQDRIVERREALAAAEAALAAFHAEHPALVSPDPRLALAERRLALEAELRAHRDAGAGPPGAARPDAPSVARARARLDELGLELQRTLRSHVEGSRVVTRVRDEIERVRDHLAKLELAATREQERSLERSRSRQRELAAELAHLARAERELPRLERRARELARERDVGARRLDAYQRELEAATLAVDVSAHELAAAVRVLERAEPPASTIIPDEAAREAWALLGAALGVLLTALLADALDRRGADHAPSVWTAHLGAGAAGDSLGVLMPSARRGEAGEPAVLLLAKPDERGARPSG